MFPVSAVYGANMAGCAVIVLTSGTSGRKISVKMLCVCDVTVILMLVLPEMVFRDVPAR